MKKGRKPRQEAMQNAKAGKRKRPADVRANGQK
jgi:hypothetical protein